MSKRILILVLISVTFFTKLALANPIPLPLPASMPLEEIDINIQSGTNGLHAIFTGNFTFDFIPGDVLSQKRLAF